MKTFTINKITPLGDYDPKFGQRYWAEANEQLEPLMFNSMERLLQPGITITAEEVTLKTSAKGTEYHGLKKVRIVEGSQDAKLASGDTDLKTQLDRIEEKLDQLIGVDEVAEVKDDEEVSLSDIPF